MKRKLKSEINKLWHILREHKRLNNNKRILILVDKQSLSKP